MPLMRLFANRSHRILGGGGGGATVVLGVLGVVMVDEVWDGDVKEGSAPTGGAEVSSWLMIVHFCPPPREGGQYGMFLANYKKG